MSLADLVVNFRAPLRDVKGDLAAVYNAVAAGVRRIESMPQPVIPSPVFAGGGGGGAMAGIADFAKAQTMLAPLGSMLDSLEYHFVHLSKSIASIRTATTPAGTSFDILREKMGWAGQGLAYFGLVNFNVLKGVNQWNALGVLRGPGLIIDLFDRARKSLFGFIPPMRLVQYVITQLVVPALTALADAMAGLGGGGGSAGASALSGNLRKLASDLSHLGAGFDHNLFTAIGAGFQIILGGVRVAASGVNAFAQRVAGAMQAAGSATGSRTIAIAAGLYEVGRAATVAGAKFAWLTARIAVAGAWLALKTAIAGVTTVLWQGTKAVVAYAAAAGRAVGKVLTLGQGFRKAAADGEAMAASTQKMSGSGGIGGLIAKIGPALGIFGGLYAAVAAAKKGISEAINFEKQSVNFEVLLHSADEAKKRMAELAKFAASTPFDLKGVMDANRMLQKFGGAALADMRVMEMVGDMAAVAGQDFSELAQWTGRLYSSLKGGRPIGDATSRLQELGLLAPDVRAKMEELAKTDPAAAFKLFTQAMQRFHGVGEKQANTIGGLWQQIKNQSLAGMRDMAAGVMGALNVKGMLQGWLKLSAWFNTSITPAIMAGLGKVSAFVGPWAAWFGQLAADVFPYWLSTVQTIFGAIGSVIATAWGFVASITTSVLGSVGSWLGGWGGSVGNTFTWIRDLIVTAFLTIEYAVINWRATLRMAALGAGLAVVRFANIVIHFFTEALPAYLQWFGRNWRNLFVDLVHSTMAIFRNLSANITTIVTEIWDYIASAGQDKVEFVWQPLLDGFVATTEALPKIAERAIGPLEESLAKQFGEASKAYGEGLGAFIAERTKEIQQQKKELDKTAEDIAKPPGGGGFDPKLFEGFGGKSGDAGGDGIQSGAAALQRGSEEAIATLNRELSNDPLRKENAKLITLGNEQIKLQTKTNELLAGLSGGALPVASVV